MIDPLTDADIRDAAAALGCDPAAVRAVLEVEAAGSGFLADGRVKILFEAHHFSRLTDGRFDASHPDISSPTWDRALYVGGAGEHDRLARALTLDAKAALMATSWGLFQIMGFNHDLCGFDSVEAFVTDQRRSERRQLMAFVRYVQARGLDAALRDHAWQPFARQYNGPGYETHGYHTRLAQAYAAARGASPVERPVLREGQRGRWVRRLQEALVQEFAGIAVDGIYGVETESAVFDFQREAGLEPDGIVGPRTWAALAAATEGRDTAAA